MPDVQDIQPLRWRENTPDADDLISLMLNEGTGPAASSKFTNRVLDRYYDAITPLPPANRPKYRRTGMNAAALAANASRFFCSGQNMFEVTEELGRQLAIADLADLRVNDLKFPYKVFWLSLRHFGEEDNLPGEPNVIDGAYVDSTVPGVISVTLTTRRTDVDRHKHGDWPLNAECCLMMIMFLDVSPDPTFRECLDVSISRDLIRLKRSRLASIKYPKLPLLPGSSEGREYSELVVVRGSNYERTVASKAADLQEINWNREALPAGERALAKVGSFLAYMSLAPEERSEVPEMPTRQERPADDVQESDSSAPPWVRPGIRKITVVGFSPAALRRRVEQHESGELSYSHTRRGHFKSQPYGPNRSLRRVIWVEDVVVRPDLPLRPGHGHQYVVKKQAQTEAEMQDHDVEE